MATATAQRVVTQPESLESPVERIGATAGIIWRLLNAGGPRAVTPLIKEVGEQRDIVLQALGWLAREDKIAIEEDARKRRIVRLK